MAERMYATGRRKTSVARVWVKQGSGKVEINKMPISEYFRRGTLELIVKQPLEYIGNVANYDVYATVSGGGWSGQAGAVRMGIARCLVQFDEKRRKPLRDGGFLTRDAREVERKKPGQKKARKRYQFSKR
ncbi:MAG: 30S ribosomal protein S9 [Spirochaetia bacterium]|jgi:small subunit ribosomal protein S9|nr:30S ribosomal protein S9 [Spirochaetia bacterium]